jgi:hypothetical protein
MAQKLNDMASSRPANFELAQQEFNYQQMFPPQPVHPQLAAQQQHQIQPKKEVEIDRLK